jgi:hypothetical protein
MHSLDTKCQNTSKSLSAPSLGNYLEQFIFNANLSATINLMYMVLCTWLQKNTLCCRANNKVEIDVCDDGLKLLCEKTDELASFKKENPEYLVSMVSRVAKNGTTTQLSEK